MLEANNRKEESTFLQWLDSLNQVDLFLFDFEQYLPEELFEDLLLVYRYWEKKQSRVEAKKEYFLLAKLIQLILKKHENTSDYNEILTLLVVKMLFLMKLDAGQVSQILNIRPQYVHYVLREYFNGLATDTSKRSRDEVFCELYLYEYFNKNDSRIQEKFQDVMKRHQKFLERINKFNVQIEGLKRDSVESSKVEKIKNIKNRFEEKLKSKFFAPWMSPLISWKKVTINSVLIALTIYALIHFPTGSEIRNYYYPLLVEKTQNIRNKVLSFFPSSPSVVDEELNAKNDLTGPTAALQKQQIFHLRSVDLLKASQNIEYILSQYQVKMLSAPADTESIKPGYEIEFLIAKDDLAELEKTIKSSPLEIISQETHNWAGEKEDGFIPVKITAVPL